MTDAPNKNTVQYIESFDSLRGISVILVLLLHSTYSVVKGGWIGVDLFFILSGYLITTLLENEFFKTGTISFKKFYMRRILRLLPPLIICVILANLLWSFTPSVEFPFANREKATLGALFYFTNFQNSTNFNLGHLWSLSVEEHFYFVWPALVILFLFKLPLKKKIICLVIFIFIVSALRVLAFNHNWSSGSLVIDPYRCTFCRIDSILLGALISFFLSSKKDIQFELNQSLKNVIIVTFIILLAAIVLLIDLHNKYWNNGGFVFTNIFCSFIVLFAITNPTESFFSNKLFIWIGKRSYGIYVYHFPIFLALESLRKPHNILNYLLVFFMRFLVSILFSAIVYRYIEQPILKLKKHFKP